MKQAFGETNAHLHWTLCIGWFFILVYDDICDCGAVVKKLNFVITQKFNNEILSNLLSICLRSVDHGLFGKKQHLQMNR